MSRFGGTATRSSVFGSLPYLSPRCRLGDLIPSSPTRHPFLEAGLVDDVPADLGARAARRHRPRALALVAVTAGQVEITLKVALLAHDLGLLEDEAVRLEEAAQVDVGEDVRRRWVAGALEAVQLDR